MERYDTLLHMSSETETTFRAVNNFLLYFLLWLGGEHHQRQPSFISINSLAAEDVYDCGIAKFPVANIGHWQTPTDFTNYRPQYLQGYWEVKDEVDYSGVSLKMAYPISQTHKLFGMNSNWCLLTKYRRYLDSKEFYFIQMSQAFDGYIRENSYRALSELLLYIKKHFPGLYLIVGDFNVQGHEKIFEYHLGSRDYHICPFYKTATCNDNEGVASPDGLVVSRELYPRIEYGVDFYPGYSYQHFIVFAKMYPSTHFNGTFDATTPDFKNFFNLLKHQYGNRDFFFGNKGIFDPRNPNMVGSADNVVEVAIRDEGPRSFLATELTKKVRGK